MCDELREQVNDRIKMALMKHIVEQDKLLIVSACVAAILDDYDLEKRTTEVATMETSNEYVVETYVAHLLLEGKRERTIQLYQTRLKHFSEFLNKDFLSVTTMDVRRYLASFLVAKKTKTYLSNIRACLSAFYAWLSKYGYIPSNPMDKVEFIRPDTKQEDPFSPEEIATMRDSCRNKLQRAILEFLLSSGLRVGELALVEIDHVDLITKEIFIPDGKGGKRRYTFMSPVCAKYLKEYMEDYKPSEFLFESNRHKKRSVRSVESIVQQIGEQSGVENVHPHRFRHTFATNLVANGMPIQDVQKLLGHAGVNTTMIYVTQTKDTIRNSYTRYSSM